MTAQVNARHTWQGARPAQRAGCTRTRTRARRRAVAALAAVLTALALVGAGAGSASAHTRAWDDQHRAYAHHHTSVLTVLAGNSADGTQEYYRLSSRRLHAGLVKIRLYNVGTVPHQVQLMRLHPGITPAKYRADLIASGGGSALAEADAAGGAAAVAPGGHQTTWVNLRSGTYVALCFQTAGDAGAPHFVHGMYASFTVVGKQPHPSAPRHVTGTIVGYSFGFVMPKVLDGHAVYRFVDVASKDTHELQFLKLLPGKTVADVKAWIAGGLTTPPPISGEAGGGGAIPPGGHEWVLTNLTPGNYVAVCFVPDDEPPHAPHAALGMVAGFTVKG